MKKDGKGKELVFEKVALLYPTIELWKVHVERCREQDKNAQIMDKAKFETLTSTIGKDNRLESLPFGYIRKNPAGNYEFMIISGHHRIRSARSAGVVEIFVLVTTEQLSREQIVSKQLAHNALSGTSDKQVLKELFKEIKDVDLKIQSGIKESDLDPGEFKNVQIDDIQLDFDFHCIKLLFLKSQKRKFEDAIAHIESDDTVLVAEYKEFEKCRCCCQ